MSFAPSARVTDYLVLMGIGDVGELSSIVAHAFAEHRGLRLEEEDYPVIAQAALDALRMMHERAEFARSVTRDLKELETQPEIHFEPEEGFPGEFVQE